MSDLIERVAKAISTAVSFEAGPALRAQGIVIPDLPDGAKWCPISADQAILAAEASIRAVSDDPDIQEIMRWLDFKSCGWHPDEQTYKGARKLLDAFQT